MVQKLVLKSRSVPLANFNREQKYALLDRFVAGGDLLQHVKELTRQQMASQLWHDLYKGRLTSSRFGEVLHCRKSTCPDNLVARILEGTGAPPTPAIRWGRSNEMDPKNIYVIGYEKTSHVAQKIKN